MIKGQHSAASVAVRAHQDGDLDSAYKAYLRAIALSEAPAADLFSNFGALLRKQEKSEYAEIIYRRGEKLHPKDYFLLRNYGNLLSEQGAHLRSLSLYLRAEESLPANPKPGKIEGLKRQQASELKDLGYSNLALKILKDVLKAEENDSVLHLGVAELWLMEGNIEKAKHYLGLADVSKDNTDLNLAYLKANLLLQLGDLDDALETFEDATSVHRRRVGELDKNSRLKYDTTCWNFSLMLLRRGLLQRGWELFEHGRGVPNGRGGMQRTIFKAHSSRIIPEWNGESLKGKRLLINGEQGIGDVMMFSMLIPPLFNEAASIGIITYDRLTKLYRRSLPESTIFDTRSIKKGEIKATDWDIQVAIGSLPRIRYSTLESYQDLNSFLVVDESEKQEIKSKLNPDATKRLVGFSWKGGGNAKQKSTKSLHLTDFLPLFQLEGFQWVSLQYGDVNHEIKDFNKEHGLNLLIAEDIDPLKNMDSWCSLVSNCDLVISAANTTVHGAGCLGVPTYVILAKEPDWRWLGEPGTPCYWYPSVKIARQQEKQSWEAPINEILKALDQRHAKIQ